ncbi:MAG: poly-gamma-glutamate biosynthesis protein PgsC, partial [Longimicrobiales bacterium]|nr:poly-gamma-glutamate biosynthesis protein PgsC [Longimicrobiales bacterium]
ELPFIGLLISLAIIGLTGVYPGGIIVPSYLVLFISEPERIVGTLVAALLTLLVYLLVSRWLILFGRRRFVFLILVGGVWSILSRMFFPAIFPLSVEFTVIGWVIPGLVANHFERQGVLVTLGSLLTATVAIAWLGRILNLV